MNGIRRPTGALARVEEAFAARDWGRAAEGLRGLLAEQPRSAALWTQLSYAESYLGQYRSARDASLRAAELAPASLEIATDTMARLRTFNEVSALMAYLARLGPPSRLPISMLLSAASRLSSLNEQVRALVLLDEARHGDPDYPPTLIARGHVLMYMGRFDEAASELRSALMRAPGIAQAYWLLAQVSQARPDDNRVARIRQLLAQRNSPSDAALLGYALHKELDDLGQYDAAWQALEQACAIKRSTLLYQNEDSRALMDALIGMSLPDPAEIVAPITRTPIFIVGMHRSGTTLLEQLLDGHPRIRGMGEMYDFTSAMRYVTDHHCKGVIDQLIVERSERADFTLIGRRYLDGLTWRLDEESHFTDKLPSNFLNIGFICRALPQAKILHMVRDPMETCFSNLRELFSDANPYSYDQLELADYFLQYQRLMQHWHHAYPGRIMDVPYARLIAEPGSVMQEVATFCGLDYVPGMSSTTSSSRAVATASAVQVRQGVQVRLQPKWVPYAEFLRPLRARLAMI